jgi:hypothetical protein
METDERAGGDRKTGALLPPVLEGKQPKEGDTRHVLAGSEDAEDAALLFRTRIELVLRSLCRSQRDDEG